MKPVEYTWPVASTTAIAALQNLAGAGTILLNGSLAPSQNTSGSGNYPVVLAGINRTITLTSANNLSAVNFTITGTTNGVASSEVLAGPNANTVTSVNPYDKIISITTNGAVNAVSAGTGTTGWTQWSLLNYDSTYFQVSVLAAVTATINYSLETTIAPDPNFVNSALLTNNPIVAMTGATTSQIGVLTQPCTHVNISINSSNGTGSLNFILLQQGIR